MVHAPTLRRLLPFGLLTNNTTFISNQSRALLCSGCSQYRVAGDAPGNADDVRSRNAVALDCEMLSCRPTKRWFLHAPPRKKKRTPVEVSVAGRCALVDYDYRVVYDSCIRPGPRTTVITNWKGIRPRDILGAPSLDEAREEILGLLAKQAGYRTRHQERSGRATDPLGRGPSPGEHSRHFQLRNTPRVSGGSRQFPSRVSPPPGPESFGTPRSDQETSLSRGRRSGDHGVVQSS